MTSAINTVRGNTVFESIPQGSAVCY